MAEPLILFYNQGKGTPIGSPGGGGVTPPVDTTYYLVDSDGEFLVDSDGEQLVDSEG